jgi:signal peptidase II
VTDIEDREQGAGDSVSRPLAGASRWTWLLAPAGLVFAADQVSKAWMSGRLAEHGDISVLPVLAWELTHNNGAAFGMLEGGNVILMLASAVALVLILVWAQRVDSRVMAASLGLLMGGALGNLADRIRLGHVVDFIALRWDGRTIFPNFNIADSAITVGACLLAYAWYRSERNRDDLQPIVHSMESAPNSSPISEGAEP